VWAPSPSSCVFSRLRARPHPASFPTRRSSDLHTAVASRLRGAPPSRSLTAHPRRWVAPDPCDAPSRRRPDLRGGAGGGRGSRRRSEEHTSELQSRENLVCRLLLEKKKQGRVCC